MPSPRESETYVNVREIYLNKIMLGACADVPEIALMDGKVQTLEDVVRRVVTVQMRGFLWGRVLETYTLEYPLDWWQALRKRWFPQWWLRRWPVLQETREISLTAYWPSLSVEVPDHSPRLVLTVNGRSEGTYGKS